MIIDILLVILMLFLLLCSALWAYLLIFMLWYKVPLISTSKKVINAALEMAVIKPGQTAVELGCGWAPFLFAAERAEPKAHYIGIEVLKPIVWLNRFRVKKRSIRFITEDFFEADLHTAHVIYCYLWDTIMADLYLKKWSSLRPGCRLISYDFPLKTLTPDKTLKFGKSTLYLYVKKSD